VVINDDQDDYPPLPEGISEALRDFLLQCFKKEPLLRKTALELLKHPWLKNPRNHLDRVRIVVVVVLYCCWSPIIDPLINPRGRDGLKMLTTILLSSCIVGMMVRLPPSR